MKAKLLLSFKCRLLIFALCISLIPITAALTLTYYFHSRNIALILGIVGSTSVIILGITIASSMSKPIKELTNATEILASGKLNHRVQISRNDEIGILANGFNTMAESLDKEITEHKLAEESLRESEQRFKTMFNSAIDGILVADPDTKNLYLGNDAICRMLGYTLGEIMTLN